MTSRYERKRPVMNLRERVLGHPVVYRTFKEFVLPKASHSRVLKRYLSVPQGSRVLDLGCGYGDAAPFFSDHCDYVGIDHNKSYIEVARKLNATTSAIFINGDVSDSEVKAHGPFDLVMMYGVLHHLPSATVVELAALAKNVLKDDGRFVAIEPVFDPNQRLLARLTIAADRGRYVRDEDGYRAILSASFSHLDATLVQGMLRIPYSHVVLTATP
jgi:SAM-dependent methyltransferase